MKASELTDNELGALLDEYRNEYMRRMDLVKVQEQTPEVAEALQITVEDNVWKPDEYGWDQVNAD